MIESIFTEIESAEFASDINVASGYHVFLETVSTHDVINKLSEELETNQRSRYLVYQRLIELLQEHNKPQYAHPYDPAIAGYLYTLSVTDYLFAISAATKVTYGVGLWWSKWLSARIMNTFDFRSYADTQKSLFASTGKATINYESSKSGNLIRKVVA